VQTIAHLNKPHQLNKRGTLSRAGVAKEAGITDHSQELRRKTTADLGRLGGVKIESLLERIKFYRSL
jgi:hypothetical protein